MCIKMPKVTLYKTDSDINPSSLVIAERACTAYLAWLRLPSKHKVSRVRSIELKNKKVDY